VLALDVVRGRGVPFRLALDVTTDGGRTWTAHVVPRIPRRFLAKPVTVPAIG
jgi:hypothetical protein